METRVAEAMFCFINEKKDGWYFSYGVTNGNGQKDAAVLPKRDGMTKVEMEMKMGELAIWYLNSPDHPNVFNTLESRITIECGREMRDLVYIFWHSVTKTPHIFASRNAEGVWEEVEEDPDWIVIGNYDRQLRQEQEKAEKRKVEQLQANRFSDGVKLDKGIDQSEDFDVSVESKITVTQLTNVEEQQAKNSNENLGRPEDSLVTHDTDAQDNHKASMCITKESSSAIDLDTPVLAPEFTAGHHGDQLSLF